MKLQKVNIVVFIVQIKKLPKCSKRVEKSHLVIKKNNVCSRLVFRLDRSNGTPDYYKFIKIN